MKPVKFVVINAALLALGVAPASLAAEEAMPADAPVAAAAEPAAPEESPEAAPTPAVEEPAADAAAAAGAVEATAAGPAEAAEPAEASATADSDTGVPAVDDTASAVAAPDPAGPMSEGDAPAAEAAPAAAERTLGQIGWDSQGRQGRIHVVVVGDTLWDISDAYLGTPWVWPSIWTDNRNIENPHLIYPGDHIWITDSEMRVITPAEAEAMLAARPAAPEESPLVEEALPPAPLAIAPVPDAQRTHRVSVREWVGLISEEQLEAAASIVKRIPGQVMLAQIDEVYIGLGEGAVQVGDEFDIIRDDERVFDPSTGRYLGNHVVVLGWLQVKEVFGETARAKIRQSVDDIGVGDKLIPRRPAILDIALRESPEDVQGSIAYFPRGRVVIGPMDFVYLNRGSLDGLEAGSPLEVIRGGEVVREATFGGNVAVPDRVVAKLLVVDAQPETSVALVSESETDLVVGDSFRGAAE